MGEMLQQYFPVLGIAARDYVVGAMLIVVLGALSGLLPSTQAWRLKITDALRRA
jgi:ABC-type lipoprotein release transport system permease subunit